MDLFKRKTSIAESGRLSGMTDWHSHLLPGVDDGVKTMDDTLKILDLYEKNGIEHVWFTPHIMEDIPNTTDRLRERFAEVQEAYKGNVILHLSAENMLDSLFEDRLEAGDLLPLGVNGRHLLVETSYYSPPTNMEDMLKRIMSKGYFPVLAHPERYVYMDDAEYKKLLDMGVMFQLNLFSLIGSYGNTARKKAIKLLKRGDYSLYGSDTHRLSSFERFIKEPELKKSLLPHLTYKGL